MVIDGKVATGQLFSVAQTTIQRDESTYYSWAVQICAVPYKIYTKAIRQYRPIELQIAAVVGMHIVLLFYVYKYFKYCL